MIPFFIIIYVAVPRTSELCMCSILILSHYHRTQQASKSGNHTVLEISQLSMETTRNSKKLIRLKGEAQQ